MADARDDIVAALRSVTAWPDRPWGKQEAQADAILEALRQADKERAAAMAGVRLSGCQSMMSPGQGTNLQCVGGIAHEGRHRRQGWTWVDGPDDDARLDGSI